MPLPHGVVFCPNSEENLYLFCLNFVPFKSRSPILVPTKDSPYQGFFPGTTKGLQGSPLYRVFPPLDSPLFITVMLLDLFYLSFYQQN